MDAGIFRYVEPGGLGQAAAAELYSKFEHAVGGAHTPARKLKVMMHPSPSVDRSSLF